MGILSTVSKGKIGEKSVCKYLRKNGYKIIETNMRNRYSEIDIIAENKQFIAFVEVKSRTGESQYRPADAVNVQKQRKIMLAARYYLSMDNRTSKQPRFDVAEVIISEKGKVESINYIENAFSQGGDYAVL